MFGIPDPGIWGVFVLCILSSILCVVYGALKWNVDGEIDPVGQRDAEWVEKEKAIEEKF